MKTVGIVVDNYKLKKFTKALVSKDIEYQRYYFTASTTLIKFLIEEHRVREIEIMCKQLEIEIKLSN